MDLRSLPAPTRIRTLEVATPVCIAIVSGVTSEQLREWFVQLLEKTIKGIKVWDCYWVEKKRALVEFTMISFVMYNFGQTSPYGAVKIDENCFWDKYILLRRSLATFLMGFPGNLPLIIQLPTLTDV